MSTRPLGSIVVDVIANARRAAIVRELIATYETPQQRKALIMELYMRGVIAPETAELFMEHFGVEAA